MTHKQRIILVVISWLAAIVCVCASWRYCETIAHTEWEARGGR